MRASEASAEADYLQARRHNHILMKNNKNLRFDNQRLQQFVDMKEYKSELKLNYHATDERPLALQEDMIVESPSDSKRDKG